MSPTTALPVTARKSRRPSDIFASLVNVFDRGTAEIAKDIGRSAVQYGFSLRLLCCYFTATHQRRAINVREPGATNQSARLRWPMPLRRPVSLAANDKSLAAKSKTRLRVLV